MIPCEALMGSSVYTRRIKSTIYNSKNEMTGKAMQLLSPRIPLKIVDVAKAQAEIATRNVSDLRIVDPLPKPTACAAGCSHCCHILVAATVPEIAWILSHIKQRWSRDSIDFLLQRLKDIVLKTKGKQPEQRGLMPCVFLADDRCRIYDARPMACRKFNSYDAKKCEKSFKEGWEPVIPKSVVQQFMVELPWIGTALALGKLGYKHFTYELHHAMLIALENSAAFTMWLKGEDVFAPARVHSNIQSQFPLTPEQVENVFQKMVKAEYPLVRNGKLASTLEEEQKKEEEILKKQRHDEERRQAVLAAYGLEDEGEG